MTTTLEFSNSYADIEKLSAWKKEAGPDDLLEVRLEWRSQESFSSLQDENIFRSFHFAVDLLLRESLEKKEFKVQLVYV